MIKKRLFILPNLKPKKNIPQKRIIPNNGRNMIEKMIQIKKENETKQTENIGEVLKHISFPTIEVNDIISNERIIRIADYTWGTDLNKFKIKNLISFNKSVQKGDIIVVRTLNLQNFFKVLNRFSEPIILISNYSDKTVDHTYKYIADHPKIYHWFAINCTLDHPKITKIPLGLGASHNAFGNLYLFSNLVQKKHNLPNRKILINYKIDRLRPARVPLNNCLLNQGFVNSYGMPMDKYWNSMINHEFILSPPGCGIDCYRIWETLYLGRIPVVIKNPALMDFKDLPILFVDNYEDLYNKLKLPDEWINKNFNWNLIKFTYWFNLIQNKKRECLGLITKEPTIIPPLIETNDLKDLTITNDETSHETNDEIYNEIINTIDDEGILNDISNEPSLRMELDTYGISQTINEENRIDDEILKPFDTTNI
jgi:hypothetical protein